MADGVRREATVEGGLWGTIAGLILGTEIVLLGAEAIFVLPVLEGVVLLGVALGAPVDVAFHEMDMATEGTGYRMHLHQGGHSLRCTQKTTEPQRA